MTNSTHKAIRGVDFPLWCDTTEMTSDRPDMRIPLRDGITLRGIEWALTPTDQGIPIILIHGLASNARLWDGPARALTNYGHGVVAVDLRGHGHSDKPDHGYDVASVADDVADVLDYLASQHPHWENPLVIGQSWGGNVVVELAHRHAERIRGVVAVDGGTIELGAMFPHWNDCAEVMSPPALAGMPASRLRSYIRTAHPDWSEEAIDGQMYNMEHLPDGTIRPWLTLDRHLMVLHGLWEHWPSRLWSEIAVPVLFTPAAKSVKNDDDFTRRKREQVEHAIETLARGRAEWFIPADHDLHAQFPDRFARTVHDAITTGFFS